MDLIGGSGSFVLPVYVKDQTEPVSRTFRSFAAASLQVVTAIGPTQEGLVRLRRRRSDASPREAAFGSFFEPEVLHQRP